MLMLLETVWDLMGMDGIDEQPSHLTIAGGAIVILTIFYFLVSERKNASPVLCLLMLTCFLVCAVLIRLWIDP